jgi:hypothetical protein
MEIQLDNKDECLTVSKVTIQHKDCSYDITIDRFGEIQIMKEQYGEGPNAIIIKPNVSNVIYIS